MKFSAYLYFWQWLHTFPRCASSGAVVQREPGELPPDLVLHIPSFYSLCSPNKSLLKKNLLFSVEEFLIILKT